MFNIKKWLGLTYYTSEADQFLDKIRRTKNHLSLSQQREASQFQRIVELRDKAKKEQKQRLPYWDQF